MCHTAFVEVNYGEPDFVICKECYDKIAERNHHKPYYIRKSIQSLRNYWGPTQPNTKQQIKYQRSERRRYKFGMWFAGITFPSIIIAAAIIIFLGLR